jgi:hypothetical protein
MQRPGRPGPAIPGRTGGAALVTWLADTRTLLLATLAMVAVLFTWSQGRENYRELEARHELLRLQLLLEPSAHGAQGRVLCPSPPPPPPPLPQVAAQSVTAASQQAVGPAATDPLYRHPFEQFPAAPKVNIRHASPSPAAKVGVPGGAGIVPSGPLPVNYPSIMYRSVKAVRGTEVPLPPPLSSHPTFSNTNPFHCSRVAWLRRAGVPWLQAPHLVPPPAPPHSLFAFRPGQLQRSLLRGPSRPGPWQPSTAASRAQTGVLRLAFTHACRRTRAARVVDIECWGWGLTVRRRGEPCCVYLRHRGHCDE